MAAIDRLSNGRVKNRIGKMKTSSTRVIVIALIFGALSACASIEKSRLAEQPINQPLLAGKGDVVLKVNKQRDLENAFGNADVFGRKTNEGFSELRFVGIEESGAIVFYRNDIRIMTNETTMSRSGVSSTFGSANTTASGSYYGNENYGTVSGSASTNYSSSTLSPTSDFHAVIPQGTTPIVLRPGETTVVMEGYILEVLDVSSGALKYKISKP